MMDTRNLQTILDDMLREVDLYQSDVKLLKNSFVSPLSPIAPDFYRFYLVDTTKIDGVDCTVLAFYPRNKSSNGFSGHVLSSLETVLCLSIELKCMLPMKSI